MTHKYFDTYILMNMFDDHNFNSNDVDKFCSQETNLYSRRHINHLLSIYCYTILPYLRCHSLVHKGNIMWIENTDIVYCVQIHTIANLQSYMFTFVLLLVRHHVLYDLLTVPSLMKTAHFKGSCIEQIKFTCDDKQSQI